MHDIRSRYEPWDTNKAEVSMTHFAVALVITAVAPCGVQNTAHHSTQLSEGMVAFLLGGFGACPPRKSNGAFPIIFTIKLHSKNSTLFSYLPKNTKLAPLSNKIAQKCYCASLGHP